MVSTAVLQHGHLFETVGAVLDLDVNFFLCACVCHVNHELDVT